MSTSLDFLLTVILVMAAAADCVCRVGSMRRVQLFLLIKMSHF